MEACLPLSTRLRESAMLSVILVALRIAPDSVLYAGRGRGNPWVAAGMDSFHESCQTRAVSVGSRLPCKLR